MKLLSGMLTNATACSAEELLSNVGTERAGMALIAGKDILGCMWEDAVGAWLDGRAPIAPAEANGAWYNLPDGIRPGALLFSAGAVTAGCAEGQMNRSDGSRCAARLCLLSPPATTPSLVEPSDVPACLDACRGEPGCA
jgi:hypothetical protein